jgi:hypothetical protein
MAQRSADGPDMKLKDPNHGAAVADEDPDFSPMDDDPAILAAAGDESSAHPERHFIVCFRDGWQFTYRGTITGPFADREEAIEEAIEEARRTRRPDVEVIVQDPDTQQTVVWRGRPAAQP